MLKNSKRKNIIVNKCASKAIIPMSINPAFEMAHGKPINLCKNAMLSFPPSLSSIEPSTLLQIHVMHIQ